MTFINVTGGAQTHFSSLLFPNVLRYSTSPTKSQLNHWLFVSTPWCARLHAPTRRQCLQNLSFNCFRSPTPCTAWGVKLIVSKVPKKQTKGTKSADLWQWKGGGEEVKKIRKVCGRHIWKPPKRIVINLTVPTSGTQNEGVTITKCPFVLAFLLWHRTDWEGDVFHAVLG